MQRNIQTHKCTLETLERELSRSSISVDCQWSDSHAEVTFAGEGIRVRDGQKVALFYIPVNCTSKRHVTDRINSILDSLETIAEAVVGATETRGGADL